MTIKIVHEKELCIGCGACTSVCEKFWVLKDDGKASLKDAKAVGNNFELVIKQEDLQCNKSAAEVCPVNCIHIFENNKKLI